MNNSNEITEVTRRNLSDRFVFNLRGILFIIKYYMLLNFSA